MATLVQHGHAAGQRSHSGGMQRRNLDKKNLAQQAKSLLALLAPKDVTETRLRVGRVSCAASGRPPGVSTVRASRRGHDADVILARGSQYSTQPASASHTFSTKLQLGKKEKKIEIDFR